jgi:hypothetical protein
MLMSFLLLLLMLLEGWSVYGERGRGDSARKVSIIRTCFKRGTSLRKVYFGCSETIVLGIRVLFCLFLLGFQHFHHELRTTHRSYDSPINRCSRDACSERRHGIGLLHFYTQAVLPMPLEFYVCHCRYRFLEPEAALMPGIANKIYMLTSLPKHFPFF